MTKSQAMRTLAKALNQHTPGARIEDDSAGDEYRLQLVAPDFKRWNETDGVHMVVSCYRGNPAWLAAAVADALPRIQSGVRDATPDELAAE